jgi:hypothetical protein
VAIHATHATIINTFRIIHVSAENHFKIGKNRSISSTGCDVQKQHQLA